MTICNIVIIFLTVKDSLLFISFFSACHIKLILPFLLLTCFQLCVCHALLLQIQNKWIYKLKCRSIHMNDALWYLSQCISEILVTIKNSNSEGITSEFWLIITIRTELWCLNGKLMHKKEKHGKKLSKKKKELHNEGTWRTM